MTAKEHVATANSGHLTLLCLVGLLHLRNVVSDNSKQVRLEPGQQPLIKFFYSTMSNVVSMVVHFRQSIRKLPLAGFPESVSPVVESEKP